jgi:hypothetical protein
VTFQTRAGAEAAKQDLQVNYDDLNTLKNSQTDSLQNGWKWKFLTLPTHQPDFLHRLA